MKYLNAVGAISVVFATSLSASSLPTFTGQEKVHMTEHGMLLCAKGALESMHISFQPFPGKTQPGWQMTLPITLRDVCLTHNGAQLVGIDEVGKIRLFMTQEARPPYDMGEEITSYKQEDMCGRVFAHPFHGNLLLVKTDAPSRHESSFQF